MYPHKCHEPLAPCGPSGAYDSSLSLSRSLTLSLASFLSTYRRQIRDIRASDYAATSVRQPTRATRGHAAQCMTVYLYLHST